MFYPTSFISMLMPKPSDITPASLTSMHSIFRGYDVRSNYAYASSHSKYSSCDREPSVCLVKRGSHNALSYVSGVLAQQEYWVFEGMLGFLG